MKNTTIFFYNILGGILIAIILLTVSFRNKISSQMFDRAMIMYGIVFGVIIITFLIKIIKSKM
ncbi:hypothetical protein Sgly_1977 [Syntrophobotulus glycolicus DSM 8271]|uniref:Uncharacterized protein n=1 Tax=Syntrophobotulus glycolicus (strain DSM 8271 / FlGlyR) TaxID=645991 RepID=F0T1D1_SYNGF|nr:hypothetical protein Sgly_1977 [Syntrophobotulus glycolicus DSM 8271]